MARKSEQVRGGRKARQSVGLMALASVAAYGLTGRMTAFAQQAAGYSGKTAVPAQLPVRRFTIAAGSLDEALKAYRDQSGMKLQLGLPLEKLATLKSAGVNGLYGSDAAIRMVLDGTGIGFQSLPRN